MQKTLVAAVVLILAYLFVGSVTANGQETFTGNFVRYGSGRYTGVRTGFFTLRLKTMTSDDQAKSFLSELQTGGQDDLLDAIKDEDIGNFSLANQLGRTVNVAREVRVGGQRKIYIVFERWTEFAELRGGFRSLDYPFGYIELTIDSRTGKGSGKYFAAAKIRWKKNKEGVGSHIEVEDYATLPAKLVNIKAEGMTP
ncbi:MAG: hypothetical protein ACKVRN_17145 [Pyrinomonadaceae bacterium]